ncbi:E3 ubiquitin-protein ligase rnf168-like isoform X2 [Macrobrachium rosenbergii]|uniref:E3 ubiquitin-protein ligase rnf168-like isoform X2 n=1 Tax=Macrobrachium rosenbergii TaxID=79674 RepID=UPI0034D5C638
MSARRLQDLKPSQLTLEDVICPICLSILVEPVTMPCSHSLCMPCFKQHVAETSLACPVCRTRISIWVRRNTKSNRLVNNRLWQMIKEKFPEKIEARLQGKDDSDDEGFFVREPRVCAPGEIRQEFEALIQQEQQELASRRSQEEEASTRLILKLQEEEKMKLRQRRAQEEQMCQEDEVLALQIKEEEKAQVKLSTKIAATPAKGPMDMYIGQSTPSSQGKLLLPDMMPHSSKMSPMKNMSSRYPGNYATSPKSMLEALNTPSASYSSHNTNSGRNNFGGFSRNNSASSNDSSDLKHGRSLREITSSQSSESESEDLLRVTKIKKNRHAATSGKENVMDLENENPHKSERHKSRLCSPKRMERHKKMSKTFQLDCSDTELETKSRKYPSDDETDIDEEDLDLREVKSKKISDVPRRKVGDEERSQVTKTKVEENFEVEDEKSNENRLYVDDNNVSLDYSVILNGEDFSADIEKLKEEQLKIEERLKQEEQDRLFAEYLQKHFNQSSHQVDRSRGSEDEYALRKRKPVIGSQKSTRNKGSPSHKRQRQTTLKEVMAKRQKRS